MPEMDGQEALKEIRSQEQNHGVLSIDGAKIIMVTALGDIKNVMKAYSSLCDAYIVKPIKKQQFIDELHKIGL